MLEPLSSLLRPTDFDHLAGQKHLVGPAGPIRMFVEKNRIPSMLFWGPPGTGKTTVAYLISKLLDAEFYHLSGVISKKEDITKIITKARKNFADGRATIVFLDEIHRWNKAQQDVLLPFVEKGIVTLIGATTENPSFTINNALISRCRVFLFKKIESEDIIEVIEKNRAKIEEYFPGVTWDDEILKLIARLGNGDLRNTLNLFETALTLKSPLSYEGEGSGVRQKLTKEDILSTTENPLYYDRDSDEHYDIISAVHKSLRDSDENAAMYWIGRMLAGGEDPRYIARRMLNFASEDVGISDPQALILANTVYDVCEKMGMPECELPLMEVAVYLARAPRDNSVYMAMKAMQSDIKQYGNLSVPLHIRNAPTKLMKDVGYGKGYEYAHNLRDKKSSQEHFPEELKGRKYFK